MKQNDFYEVDGCMDFIPVTINETYADGVGVIVSDIMRDYRLLLELEQVYRFPKVKEPQKPVVPKFVAEWIEANEKKEFYARLDNLIFDSYVHQLGSDMTSFIYGRTEKIKELIFAYEFGYEVE